MSFWTTRQCIRMVRSKSEESLENLNLVKFQMKSSNILQSLQAWSLIWSERCQLVLHSVWPACWSQLEKNMHIIWRSSSLAVSFGCKRLFLWIIINNLILFRSAGQLQYVVLSVLHHHLLLPSCKLQMTFEVHKIACSALFFIGNAYIFFWTKKIKIKVWLWPQKYGRETLGKSER